jgi:hypothetical protein
MKIKQVLGVEPRQTQLYFNINIYYFFSCPPTKYIQAFLLNADK